MEKSGLGIYVVEVTWYGLRAQTLQFEEGCVVYENTIQPCGFPG